MKENIKECTKCISDESIEGVVIGEDGLCNHCRDYKPFVPYGEEYLLKSINKAKRKNRIYDALVPISGGKDSTYVLYLAVKKYKLNVLTYTFDNGFMSDFAKKNIETSVKKCGVDHIWVKHDKNLIRELYRTALIHSGEICGICGVGIERSLLKILEAYKIPLTLLGHTPAEDNSFTSEGIYDQKRIKAVLSQNRNISKQMIKRYLVYPKLNFLNAYIYTKLGRFGRKVNMLYYIDALSDKEISELLVKEMDWLEPNTSEYTRHFDCIAEPFTNYIREKRLRSSRRIPQLSNMVRDGEITREEAIKIAQEDKKNPLPDNYNKILDDLSLTESDIDIIGAIPKNVFGDVKSNANRFFAFARNILKKNSH